MDMHIHEAVFFMGIPIAIIWLPILIGVIVGIIIPLTPFVRSKLHFTIVPEDDLILDRDTDALAKLIPNENKGKLRSFCKLLRKLGLTLYVEHGISNKLS